jgi:hypothetical protein
MLEGADVAWLYIRACKDSEACGPKSAGDSAASAKHVDCCEARAAHVTYCMHLRPEEKQDLFVSDLGPGPF